MLGLKVIDEELMYKILSIPSYIGKEHLMMEFILAYAKEKGYDGGIDEKGNVYICKGIPPENGYYPCVSAHMDTVQYGQRRYTANTSFMLKTLVLVEMTRQELSSL